MIKKNESKKTNLCNITGHDSSGVSTFNGFSTRKDTSLSRR